MSIPKELAPIYLTIVELPIFVDNVLLAKLVLICKDSYVSELLLTVEKLITAHSNALDVPIIIILLIKESVL